jgi:hypothetical protein
MPRSPLRIWGRSFRNSLSLSEMPCCFVLQRGTKRNGKQIEQENRRLALEAGWRGTREELRMPVASDGACFKNRLGCLDVHQHDDGGCDRDRCRRMHHDAERAVIGVGIDRVDVGYLHHRQQRQQHQTHNGCQRQSTKLCAAISAEICLKCSQNIDPLLKNTHY